MQEQNRIHPLWGLGLGWLLIRAAGFIFSHNYGYDAVTRSWLAWDWSRSPSLNPAHFFTPQLAPLPIWIMGSALRLWPNIELVPRLVALVFGWGSLFPLYFLTRRLFDESAAVWACLWGGFCSLQIKSAGLASSEAIFCFFLLWAVFFIFSYRETGRKRYLAGGIIFINLAAITRYNGLIYLGLLSLVILKKECWQETLTPALIFLGLGIILPATWFWLNWHYLGQGLYPLRFILGEHARVFAGLRPALADRFYNLFFLPGVMILSLGPLAALSGIWGIRAAWKQRNDARWLLLLMAAPPAYYIFKSVVMGNFFLLARFATDPTILWLPFAGFGVKTYFLKDTLKPENPPSPQPSPLGGEGWVRGIVVSMTVWLGLLVILAEARLPVISDKLESVSPVSRMTQGQQAAARYLAEHLNPDELVLITHNPFWQELEIIFYSRHPREKFLRAGANLSFRRQNIKWVVLIPQGVLRINPADVVTVLNQQGFKVLRVKPANLL